MKVGDPLLAETEVGPLILPREADRVPAWIDEAVGGGARLIGGGRINSTTLKPSIIVHPRADAKVFRSTSYSSTAADDAIAPAPRPARGYRQARGLPGEAWGG